MENLIYFKPNVLDIESMQKLVSVDVENGNILDRNSNEMATTIRSYIAVKTENNDEIIGFVALHIHTIDLAEIRSLVVKENFRKHGIAKILIQKAIDEAKTIHLKRLLVLTYKKELFESFDFIEIAKESIPETKIWADCIKCKHFPICDEVSLTLDI
ncbi:MAG: N-acetyltransferase [Campylobacterota bacterium]|nr:N-acetyltransferase [Campylobacterota bacterium]